MLLSIGIVVMCVGLASGVFWVILPRIGSMTPLGAFLRGSALSGAISVGAGALSVMGANGGGPLTRAGADAALVLAPGMLCAALVARDGRRSARATLAAIALAALVAVSSALLPTAIATAVKAGALAAACGLCAALAARAPRRIPRRSMAVLVAAMGGLALYSAVRAVSPLTGGALTPLFSFTATAAAGVTAMLLTGVSVALVGRPAAGDAGDGRRRRASVSIGDWHLARAALGRERVRLLLLDLRLAARDLDPSAIDGPRGVEVSHPSAASMLRLLLADDYGWRPEEVELITEAPSRHWASVAV